MRNYFLFWREDLNVICWRLKSGDNVTRSDIIGSHDVSSMMVSSMMSFLLSPLPEVSRIGKGKQTHYLIYLSVQVCFKWAIPVLFFFIVFFTIHRKQCTISKSLPMAGFKPHQTYDVWSDRSTNWVTSTAIKCAKLT